MSKAALRVRHMPPDDTSAPIPREPNAGEDLPALRQVPVSIGVAGDDRMNRPGAASQHAIPAFEKHLAVLSVRKRTKALVRPELRHGPLVDIAQQLLDSVRRGAVWEASDRRRAP